MKSGNHSDTRSIPTPSIRYWILSPRKGGRYSPFQGYGLEILNPKFATLIDLMATLPSHLAEIFLRKDDLGKFRRAFREKNSSIIGEDYFEQIYESIKHDNCIDILIGLPHEIKSASKYVNLQRSIMISTEDAEGIISLPSATRHVSQLIDDALTRIVWPDTTKLELEGRLGKSTRGSFPIGDPPEHAAGVTIPNEVLCLSLGAPFSPQNRFTSTDPSIYVKAIIESADRARMLIGEQSTDIILYCPSLIREHYTFQNEFWNKLLREIKNKKARSVVKDGVFRNPWYSGISIKDPDDGLLKSLYEDPVIKGIVGLRQSELRICSSGIAALACSMTAPALRLPNGLNFSLGALQEIERHATRNDDRGQSLLQKSYISLTTRMSNDIDYRLLDYVKDHGEAVTIVADFPVEWLRISNIPIMLRHECSRIPMTPGNVMLSTCIEADPLQIPASALHDVLVIRSFNSNDPIRSALEFAVDGFGLKNVKVTFIDVDDECELVKHLNSFKGYVVIFDCHGNHGGKEGAGWLQIGKDRVDTWDLAHAARIPPIVILSACSTFALAGSHASVASGLIRSGAITVLGTFLPVDAIKSAIFVARLLFRIDQFLPALGAFGMDRVTWRTLISTFFRMSYCTDVISFFRDRKNMISADVSERIGISSNFDVNQLNSKWHDNLLRRIARASGISRQDVQLIVDSESPLMETMLYCQTGRPELIQLLVQDELGAKEKSETDLVDAKQANSRNYLSNRGGQRKYRAP